MLGVCVFDIDHTLTCGDPRPLIAECKRAGYAFAINTARPKPHIYPVSLQKIGIPVNTPILYNPDSYSQSSTEIAEQKATHMHTIQQAFGVKRPENVVLMDDNDENVDVVRSYGFRAIHVPRTLDQCGLSEDHARLFIADL